MKKNKKDITINSSSIVPMIDISNTQYIFQRHCAYDKSNDTLISESVEKNKEIVNNFIKKLNKLNPRDLYNTYFLFTISPTINGNDFKRCLETIKIVIELLKRYYEEVGLEMNRLINIDNIHESRHLTEPSMFTDESGYLEFLKDKNSGINQNFWVDFEEDNYKEDREIMNGEGPDEIVKRAEKYISILHRYAKYFHEKNRDSKLIIWNVTHYDLISPLCKQDILKVDKDNIVLVDYAGGISLFEDDDRQLLANLNNTIYEFDFQYIKQLHRRF